MSDGDQKKAPESKPKRYVTRAPRPIEGLTGSYANMPGSDVPSRKPVELPDDYAFMSQGLQVEIEAILCRAARKFPLRAQLWELCRGAVAEMTPYLHSAVSNKTVQASAAKRQMRLLVHELLICNSGRFRPLLSESPPSMEYPLEHDVARSAEWQEMVEAIRDAEKQATQPRVIVPPARTWEEVEITFLSEERIQVGSGTNRGTYNYSEFGFQDRRNGKPNAAWYVLDEMAKFSGRIPRPQPGKDRARIQKRIEEIRERLRAYFEIESDPVPWTGSFYQASFKITRGPAYDM